MFATSVKTSFEEMPGYFSTLFGSIQVMQQAIVQKMLEIRPPDIDIRSELGGFRTLQFRRVDEIYRRAEAAKDELRRMLAAAIESRCTGRASPVS